MSATTERGGVGATWACQCEHERHLAACPNNQRELGARALHVGEVCDPCARGCLRDYVTQIGNHRLEEQTITAYCHQGVDGPTCRGHVPQLTSHAVPVLVSQAHEILGDFHGDQAWENARSVMFALADGATSEKQSAVGNRATDEVAMRSLASLASSEAAAMELWWKTTSDDWPVPEWLPARFIDEVLTRVLSPSPAENQGRG